MAIGTLDNDQFVYIDQRSQGGPFGFRIEVGRRARSIAPPWARRCWPFPPRMISARSSSHRIERFTPNTLVDPELLLADLALTRARGYAISNGEHVEGVVSVAAPVFDHTGKAIGAIGMFGPSSRNPVERCMISVAT